MGVIKVTEEEYLRQERHCFVVREHIIFSWLSDWSLQTNCVTSPIVDSEGSFCRQYLLFRDAIPWLYSKWECLRYCKGTHRVSKTYSPTAESLNAIPPSHSDAPKLSKNDSHSRSTICIHSSSICLLYPLFLCPYLVEHVMSRYTGELYWKKGKEILPCV